MTLAHGLSKGNERSLSMDGTLPSLVAGCVRQGYSLGRASIRLETATSYRRERNRRPS